MFLKLKKNAFQNAVQPSTPAGCRQLSSSTVSMSFASIDHSPGVMLFT